MAQLPEFLRTEVYHPLTVHFPIVLLLIATAFKVIALFVKREVWQLGGRILLAAGVIAAWAAIYTGDLADGIVSRQICDPTVLYSHEQFAYTVAWLFTAAAFVEGLSLTVRKLGGKWVSISIVLLMLAGSGFLTYVGHLGAKLVYQQAAGVYVPSKDCSEFEN